MAISTITGASTGSTGTVITTGSSGQVIPKAALPTGSVLQVVSSTYSTQASNSTTTATDTGLTATITPTSATSKILVLVTQTGCRKSSGNAFNAMYLNIVRNSTQLVISNYAGYQNLAQDLVIGEVSLSYLDSPSTTSATTYKTQFWNFAGASNITVQDGGSYSTITLLEVAA